jgi:hypothetical protein
MNLNEQDRVASVAKIAREDAEEGEPNALTPEAT